eukprot:scaffold307808_cov33-Tisochrysis_lutea.AAC.1
MAYHWRDRGVDDCNTMPQQGIASVADGARAVGRAVYKSCVRRLVGQRTEAEARARWLGALANTADDFLAKALLTLAAVACPDPIVVAAFTQPGGDVAVAPTLAPCAARVGRLRHRLYLQQSGLHPWIHHRSSLRTIPAGIPPLSFVRSFVP